MKIQFEKKEIASITFRHRLNGGWLSNGWYLNNDGKRWHLRETIIGDSGLPVRAPLIYLLCNALCRIAWGKVLPPPRPFLQLPSFWDCADN
jgi:hypothetical protein